MKELTLNEVISKYIEKGFGSMDAERQRDITSDHTDKSRRVYPTMVGFPVVPEEACTRTISEAGAA